MIVTVNRMQHLKKSISRLYFCVSQRRINPFDYIDAEMFSPQTMGKYIKNQPKEKHTGTMVSQPRCVPVPGSSGYIHRPARIDLSPPFSRDKLR